MLLSAEVLKGLASGAAAGFASGLLGVSPGGILVPAISLALGFPQHLAHAVSLVCPSYQSGGSLHIGAGTIELCLLSYCIFMRGMRFNTMASGSNWSGS
jgi:uncharacterized membrane protein YfcA